MTDVAITKPGYKTTEFWVTMAMGVIGLGLTMIGKDTLGASLLAMAGLSYNGSRGLAKLNLGGLFK